MARAGRRCTELVGSLFNSFLFDFTEGWLYVLGVGVAGGMVLRQFDAARAGRENPQNMILDDLAQHNANAP